LGFCGWKLFVNQKLNAMEKRILSKTLGVKTVIVYLFFAFLTVIAGCKDDDNNNNNSNDNLNSTDRDFIAKVTEANKAEIDAGQTAASKGNMASVRSFGQQMVTDHSAAKLSLDSLANSLSVSLSDSLSAEHQALKQALTAASGYAFDTLYIGSQVRDHQKVLGIFDNEISNGKHDAVKGWATRFRPKIQMHLQEADSIRNTL
jgi:putative membrane protein